MINSSKPSNESIIKEIFKTYNSLSSHGKPKLRDSNVREWTILSSFCLCLPPSTPSEEWKVKCVSLGTGLSCLPFNQLPVHGDILHDSHSEIIAKRGLQLYLYNQIELFVKGIEEECYLEGTLKENKFKLKDGIQLIMYISTLPCGDASTYSLSLLSPPSPILAPSSLPSSSIHTPFSTTLLANSLGLNTSRSSSPSSIANSTPQVRRGRVGYSVLSSLRTKPGRIDSSPSISHSCSDKLALWSVLGVQGSLLSSFFDEADRIKIDVLILGGVEVEERDRVKQEVERAVGGRLMSWNEARGEGELNVPTIEFIDEDFRDGREKVREVAGVDELITSCMTSISYIDLYKPERQIIEKGLKQGSPNKRVKGEALILKDRSRLSKLSLFGRYFEVMRLISGNSMNGEDLTYYETKHSIKCQSYQDIKASIRDIGSNFEGWLVSGKDYENFRLNGRLDEE